MCYLGLAHIFRGFVFTPSVANVPPPHVCGWEGSKLLPLRFRISPHSHAAVTPFARQVYDVEIASWFLPKWRTSAGLWREDNAPGREAPFVVNEAFIIFHNLLTL